MMYNMLQRVIALIIFILLIPLFILISLAIKIESKGPVFFKQKRVGINGRKFIIYKFRSMKINAPNVATRDLYDSDYFITKVGRFLRKTSLDELPQLINIIKGDMLFIGPRPIIPEEEILNSLRLKEGIYTIYPGITGWAQINGRDELDIHDKIMFDKEYLENKSIIFDLKILIITIFRVIKREGVVEGSKEKI